MEVVGVFSVLAVALLDKVNLGMELSAQLFGLLHEVQFHLFFGFMLGLLDIDGLHVLEVPVLLFGHS